MRITADEHRLTCQLGPDVCRCTAHVDPTTHVPVCPYDSTPLQLSTREDPRGFCPACFTRGHFAHHPADTWAWVHRDTFAGEDAPPWDGHLPIRIGGPTVAVLTIAAERLDDAVRALDYADLVPHITLVYSPPDEQPAARIQAEDEEATR